MSETYYIVRDIIKEKMKEHYGLSLKEKLVALSLGLGFGSIFLSFYYFNNLVIRNLSFLFSLILVINYFRFLFKKRQQDGKKNPYELISKINNALLENRIDNLQIIEGVQLEIEEDLKEKESEKMILFKRISTVFLFVFWVPFGFLSKYFFETSFETLSWELYITFTLYLVQIAAYLIGFILMVGNQFDLFVTFGKSERIDIRRYLNDVKYHYYE